MSSEETKRIENFRVEYLRDNIELKERLIRGAPNHIARMQKEVDLLTATMGENERKGHGRDWELVYDLEDFTAKLKAAHASTAIFARELAECKAELASILKAREEKRSAEATTHSKKIER